MCPPQQLIFAPVAAPRIYNRWWGWHIDYAIRTEDMDAGIREVAAIVNARAEKRNEPLRLRSAPASINVQSKHVHEG